MHFYMIVYFAAYIVSNFKGTVSELPNSKNSSTTKKVNEKRLWQYSNFAKEIFASGNKEWVIGQGEFRKHPQALVRVKYYF